MKRLSLLVFTLILVFTTNSYTQRKRIRLVGSTVSNPLTTNRISSYWATAGWAGTSHSVQCGSTISAYNGTGATINQAIQNCKDTGQHVQLGSGTFNITTPICWSRNNVDASDVEVWGSGMFITTLNVTGSSGDTCNTGGNGCSICIVPNLANYSDQPQGTGDWTSGYTIGTTTITINNSNVTYGPPFVGAWLALDQFTSYHAGITDIGRYWTCGAGEGVDICCLMGSCSRGPSRTYRGQVFWTRITSVSGTGTGPFTVGIADPLVNPNWNESPGNSSPQAWWMDYATPPIHDVGMRNITINSSNQDANIIYAVSISNSYNVMFDYARSLLYATGARSNWKTQQVAHSNLQHSYLYGKGGSTGNYGVESFGNTNMVFIDNIMWGNSTFVSDATINDVFAYNYIYNDSYINPNWEQPGHYYHSAGNSFDLIEGNDGTGAIFDVIHGPAFFVTMFRNSFSGWENGKYTGNTPAITVGAINRYMNIVGNILGTTGFHNTYETYAGGSASGCVQGIFSLGWSGNCSSGTFDDVYARNTSMRWGNCDAVTGFSSCKFTNSEVPNNDPAYPNSIPVNQNLPKSQFGLTSAPPWWNSSPFPPIGPDVNGGTVANKGGHVYPIPARERFESSSIDNTYAVAKSVTGASYNATGINATWPLITLTVGSHSFQVGDSMKVTGISPAGYNINSVLIYSVDATHVSFGTLDTNPGAYSSGGTVYSPDIRTW